MSQSTQKALEEPTWPPDGWITKKEAADRLNLSEPRIAAMAGDGTLESRKERNPVSKQVVTLINAVAVDRLGFERENPNEVTKALAAKPEKREKPTDAAVMQAEGRALPTWLQQALQELQPLKAPQPKPWLTLDEAEAFSGLTKNYLRKRAGAREGELTRGDGIKDMGKHAPGGRWRFHRDSLAAV